MIAMNQLVMFTIPDIYFVFHPDSPLTFLYLFSLNEGMINIIIFITTQQEIKKLIASDILRCFGKFILRKNIRVISKVNNITFIRSN